jgi:hypothetical protein
VDEPLGVVEQFQTPATLGVKTGQEDVRDPFGPDAGPFVQSRRQRRRGQTGVHQDRRVAGADERRRGVPRPHGNLLAPQGVARQRADADHPVFHAAS